jgi:hypothetical protein
MNNFWLIILGYLFIFFSLALGFYRLRKVNLTEEDYLFWFKIENSLSKIKEKIFSFIKISEKEIVNLWINLIEKFLRRIKVESLKIEVWASKKLENLKNNNFKEES